MGAIEPRFPVLATQSLKKFQPHLVARFKAQGLVEMSSVFAGMQGDSGEALLLTPSNHGLHNLAGDAAPAILRVGVDIENGRAAAFEIVGVGGPRADHNRASPHDSLVVAGEPRAE